MRASLKPVYFFVAEIFARCACKISRRQKGKPVFFIIYFG